MLQARNSNLRHRPIGIGIQGLADLFMMMRLPYESNESRLLNQQIFETIYYGALEASCELAQKLGPYETYEGSPVSKGVRNITHKPKNSRQIFIMKFYRFYNTTCGK